MATLRAPALSRILAQGQGRVRGQDPDLDPVITTDISSSAHQIAMDRSLRRSVTNDPGPNSCDNIALGELNALAATYCCNL
jgi:hypothetical protein